MFKLLIYEFKNTWKYYLLVLLVFFVMIARIPVSYTPRVDVISMSFAPMVMTYSLFSIAALFLVAGLLFVKHMFKKRAAFTCTLPVSTHQILFAQWIVAFVWIGISTLFIVFAVFIQFAMSSSNSDIAIVIEAMKDVMELLITQLTTYPIPLFVSALKVAGTLLEILLLLYLCLSFTHTSWIRSFRTLIGISLFLILMVGMGEQMLREITQPMFVPYSMTRIGYQLKLLSPIYIKCFIAYLLTWYLFDKKVEV